MDAQARRDSAAGFVDVVRTQVHQPPGQRVSSCHIHTLQQPTPHKKGGLSFTLSQQLKGPGASTRQTEHLQEVVSKNCTGPAQPTDKPPLALPGCLRIRCLQGSGGPPQPLTDRLAAVAALQRLWPQLVPLQRRRVGDASICPHLHKPRKDAVKGWPVCVGVCLRKGQPQTVWQHLEVQPTPQGPS